MLELLLTKLEHDCEWIAVPKLERPADPYHLEQNSELEPALGHTFDKDLQCGCGLKWEEHQKDALLCPSLVERLQSLALLEAKIRALLRRSNERERQLKDRLKRERDARLKVIEALKMIWCDDGAK